MASVTPTKITAQVPFCMIPKWVLHAAISSNAVRVYGVLHERADKTDLDCYPSRRWIAEHCHFSKATVDRALEELVALGAITVEHRWKPDGKEYSSSIYNVIFVNPKKIEVAPPADHLVPPVMIPSPTRDDISRTINKNNTLMLNSDFDALWASYPRKVGKAAARKAFDKMCRIKDTPPIDVLVEAVKSYALTVTDLKYCAHLATWLNGQRWADETKEIPTGPDPVSEQMLNAIRIGASHGLAGYSEQQLCDATEYLTEPERQAAFDAYKQRRHTHGINTNTTRLVSV